MRLYNECQAVEQALRQKIIEAIEPGFWEALQNPVTYMVTETIAKSFNYLHQT